MNMNTKMNQTACQIEIEDLRAMVLPAVTTQLPDTDHDAEGALYIAMVGRKAFCEVSQCLEKAPTRALSQIHIFILVGAFSRHCETCFAEVC